MVNIEILWFCLLGVWLIITGRLFCGKLCPLGYAQDIIFKIPFFVKIRTFKPDKYLRSIKYFNVFINYLLLPALAYTGLYRITQNTDSAEISPIIMVPVIGAVITIAVIIRRPFCKYLCPVGAISSLFNKISIYKYKTFNDKCIQCDVCSGNCKMDIIPYKTNNSFECIRCGNCKKVCPNNAIDTGFNFKIGSIDMFKSFFNNRFFHRSICDKTGKIVCAENKCTLCGKCQKVCPVKAIVVDKRAWLYYSYRCIKCGRCITKCPAKALIFTKKDVDA
jgi:polyferredoxin